jgi:hypothetical protein
MKKLLLITTFLFLLTAYETASACSCGGYPSPCAAYNAADAVFVGDVKKVAPENTEIHQGIGEQTVYVQVEEAFKGVKENQEIIFHQPGHNCAPKYATGLRCLFYATFDEKNKTWEVYGCNRGGALNQSEDDLLYLRALPVSATKTRISGMLENYETTPEKGFELVKLISGAKVKITGEEKTYEVYTDRNGVYEIYDLPPGKYLIEPEIPQGLKIRFPMAFGLIDFSQKNSVGVELKESSCAGANFVLSSDTLIKGKVLGVNGEAMKGVCLELLPVDKPASSSFRISDCTEADGSYEMKEIPPGNYLIILNKDGKLSGSEPFNPLYFPGVSDKNKASVLSIKTGEKLENYNIHIPSEIPTILLQGRLVFSDGQPVVDRSVGFKYEDKDNRYETIYSQTDEQGQFSIKVIQGTTGLLISDLYLGLLNAAECPHIKKLMEQFGNRMPSVDAKSIKIDAKQNIEGLTLTFPFPFCPKKKEDN